MEDDAGGVDDRARSDGAVVRRAIASARVSIQRGGRVRASRWSCRRRSRSAARSSLAARAHARRRRASRPCARSRARSARAVAAAVRSTESVGATRHARLRRAGRRTGYHLAEFRDAAAEELPDRVLPDNPAHRPLERFWPYAELSEQPTDEELAKLHPELREALFGAPRLPFSISLVFPQFDGDDYARAVELARASDEYVEIDRRAARCGTARGSSRAIGRCGCAISTSSWPACRSTEVLDRRSAGAVRARALAAAGLVV